MGWGFVPGADCNSCCSGCEVKFTAITCPDAISVWGNFYPPELIPSSSAIQVYVAKCNDLNTPVSDVFYPLKDPLAVTGIHTFKYPKTNDNYCLYLAYQSGYYLLNFFATTNVPLTNCQTNVRVSLAAVASKIITEPCYYNLLQDGATYYYTWDRSYWKAVLDEGDGVIPSICSYIDSNGFYHCGCIGCRPSNAICKDGPGNNYYKVFYNTPSVTFKVTKDGLDSIGYNSDFHLLYAYVTYFPQGTADTCLCVTPGCSPCYSGASNGVFATNFAKVSFLYGCMIADPVLSAINCNSKCLAIYDAYVPGLASPIQVDCGQPGYKNCFGLPDLHCYWDGFCGSDAFSQAESFVNNLPKTLQLHQYGAINGGSTIEDFSGDTPQVNCPGWTCRNSYVAYDCNGNVVFDGDTSLTFSPQ